MMSPEMIRQILLKSDWNENKISQQVLVPCFNSFSMRNSLKLRDIRFVGGASELGNDIEFYELFGPDFLRFYTGVQVKRGDIGQGDAGNLSRQGGEAFEKDIQDASSGASYRINRWVVAATGSISDPARREICKQLQRHAKLIHFWDGLRLSTMIMEYWYREFLEALGVDPHVAASNNVRTIYWDPDDPREIHPSLSSTTFVPIDVSAAMPPTNGGILITARPLDKNIPSVKVVVRSAVDEIVMDSVQSQLQPYLLRAEGNGEIQAMVLDATRPVQLLARGYLDIL